MHIFYLTIKLTSSLQFPELPLEYSTIVVFLHVFPGKSLSNLSALSKLRHSIRLSTAVTVQWIRIYDIYCRHIYVNMLSDICAVLIEISRVNWSCYWISNFMRLQISHALTSLVTRDESKSEYIKCIKYTLESSGPLWLGSAWVSCNWLLFSLLSFFFIFNLYNTLFAI